MRNWIGPESNPFRAAQKVVNDETALARLEAVVLNIFNWVFIFPSDNLLDDILQEIAGETNIVVQYRTDGWYACIDE